MTKAKAAAQAAGLDLSAIDDEQQYAVTLKRPVKVGRAWVRPGQAPLLKGKIIKENADAIGEFTAT